MDFTLSDDQQLLRDTARGLLEKECPASLVRAYQDDVSAADRLWEHLLEWTELGRGPLVDLCLFLEEMGAVVAPGPFFATTVLWAPLGLEGTGTVWFADDPTMPYVLDADRADKVAIIDGELPPSRVDSASSTRSMLMRLPSCSSIHMRAPPAPQHMDRSPWRGISVSVAPAAPISSRGAS